MRGTAPILIALAFVGCQADQATGSDGGTDDACAPGLVALGPACIPRLDDCAADEVPLQGGGCKRVGVRECPGGLAGPPDWTCKRIGPPTTCKSGWKLGTGGWCEPVLPAAPCPAGTRAELGKSTCQPFGDCGTGTWGNIKTTASTIFVDGSYTGGSEDGSKTRPYSTIKKALSTTLPGAHVALAAGTYAEDISIYSPWLKLEGRCTKLVKLTGSGTSDSLALKIWVGGVTVKGISVSSTYLCIVSDGRQVTIEDVEVRKCGNSGLKFFNGSATVRDTVIEGVGQFGVAAVRSRLNPTATRPAVTLERVVVRGTRPPADSGDNVSGYGIFIEEADLRLKDTLLTRTSGVGITVTEQGTVTLERSVVSRNHEYNFKMLGMGNALAVRYGSATVRDSLINDNQCAGIYVPFTGTLLLERSVVSGTRSSSTNDDGMGVLVGGGNQGKAGPQITIRESLLVGNQSIGVYTAGAETLIERSVVRDTRRLAVSSQEFDQGYGIKAKRKTTQSAGSKPVETLTVRDSLVAGNASYGVVFEACKATLERVVVRDTRIGQTPIQRISIGIVAWPALGSGPRAALVMRDSLITGNRTRGLYAEAADLLIERSVVRDTRGDVPGNPPFGYGMNLLVDRDRGDTTKLSLVDSVVAHNTAVGIQLVGAQAVIKRSVVRDTRSPCSPPLGCVGGFGINGYEGEVKTGSLLSSSIDLYDSLVADNHRLGLNIEVGKARVLRSVISGTRKDKEGYGDGLAVDKRGTLLMTDSLVEGNDRAGVLFYGGGGTVTRSVLRANKVPVALDQGAAPALADDNVFAGNEENAVARGRGFKPAKLPEVVPSPKP